MALTESVDKVDETGREILTYGTEDFPIAFFDDDLSKVEVVPHWHKEFEFDLITEGRTSLRIAGKEIPLSAGEGCFVNSGILHSETLLSRTGHQHAMVFSPRVVSFGEDRIWKSCVSPFLENPRLPFIRLTGSTPWQEEILEDLEEAWTCGAYERPDYPILVRYLLSLSLSALAKQAGVLEGEDGLQSRYPQEERRIKKALLFIERNYAEPVTLEEIARSADVSPSTCLRLFKALLGTTPVHYLLEYRLQKAVKELRLRGSRTIAEIAYSCGFSDASYFDRCFQKKYGMAPSQYPLPSERG